MVIERINLMRLFTFNRTIVELKRGNWNSARDWMPTFNRTIVELKLIEDIEDYRD